MGRGRERASGPTSAGRNTTHTMQRATCCVQRATYTIAECATLYTLGEHPPARELLEAADAEEKVLERVARVLPRLVTLL